MRAEISGFCQKYKKNFEVWRKFTEEKITQKTHTQIYGKDSIDKYIHNFKEVLGWVKTDHNPLNKSGNREEDNKEIKVENADAYKKSSRTFRKKYANFSDDTNDDANDDYVIGKKLE